MAVVVAGAIGVSVEQLNADLREEQKKYAREKQIKRVQKIQPIVRKRRAGKVVRETAPEIAAVQEEDHAE